MSKCNILFIYIILAFSGTQAQDTAWSIEFSGGIPYNFPSPLVIEQQGEPTLRLTARYSSEPFRSPIYYVWRIGRWKDGRAWEFESVSWVPIQNGQAVVWNFPVAFAFGLGIDLAAKENDPSP